MSMEIVDNVPFDFAWLGTRPTCLVAAPAVDG